MGTRSSIAIKNPDGTVECVYCHWDGYPEHNGKILQEHYRNETKLRELLTHGDISSLAPKIGSKHDFDNRRPNECNFYGRDRCENDVSSRKHCDINTWLEVDGQAYNYIFDPSANEWYLAGQEVKTTVVCSKLTETLNKDQGKP
jgi:hypothetical protein